MRTQMPITKFLERASAYVSLLVTKSVAVTLRKEQEGQAPMQAGKKLKVRTASFDKFQNLVFRCVQWRVLSAFVLVFNRSHAVLRQEEADHPRYRAQLAGWRACSES